MFCFFWLAFLALWFRAWQLQMMEGPNLAEKARRQHTTSEMVTGKRGMILDRNGRVMARSVEVFSVYAKPAEISDYLTVANTLGPLLGLAAIWLLVRWWNRRPQPVRQLSPERRRVQRQFFALCRKLRHERILSAAAEPTAAELMALLREHPGLPPERRRELLDWLAGYLRQRYGVANQVG